MDRIRLSMRLIVVLSMGFCCCFGDRLPVGIDWEVDAQTVEEEDGFDVEAVDRCLAADPDRAMGVGVEPEFVRRLAATAEVAVEE